MFHKCNENVSRDKNRLIGDWIEKSMPYRLKIHIKNRYSNCCPGSQFYQPNGAKRNGIILEYVFIFIMLFVSESVSVSTVPAA